MTGLVPSGVTTVTSTVPLAGVGGVARMMVSLWTVKLGEGVAPKRTAVAPVKPQPQIVIGSLAKFWLGPIAAPIVGPWLEFIPMMRGVDGTVVPEKVGVPGLSGPTLASRMECGNGWPRLARSGGRPVEVRKTRAAMFSGAKASALVTAVIWVSETTVKLCTGLVFWVTAPTLLKDGPVMRLYSSDTVISEAVIAVIDGGSR